MGSSEMRSVEGDPMLWPHPQDVIQYARSSYYFNNVYLLVPGKVKNCYFHTPGKATCIMIIRISTLHGKVYVR